LKLSFWTFFLEKLHFHFIQKKILTFKSYYSNAVIWLWKKIILW
jgi:hypothetical protein